MCSCTVGRSSSFFIDLSLTRSRSGCWMDLLEDIFDQTNLSLTQNSKTQTRWLLGSTFLPREFHLCNRGATPIRNTVGISLQFVTIVVIIFIHVICNYSCIYSYLLTKSIYLNAVILANCICIVFILYLFLIYWKSYLFLFIVNQYMYSKFK